MARGQGNIPVQATADMPNDFFGPVDQLPMGTTLATAPASAARAALAARSYPSTTAQLSSARVPQLVQTTPALSGFAGLGSVVDDASATVKQYAFPLAFAFLIGVGACYAYRSNDR